MRFCPRAWRCGLPAVTERHERYAKSFGLDPAAGRRAIAAMNARRLTLEDGPVLRLERRYERRVERVWRALTDPDELRHWYPTGEALRVTDLDQWVAEGGW